MLEDAGHDVVYRSLDDEDWGEVLDDEVDLIAVAGGDGSVRKLFTAIGGAPILALLMPVGSANNIARTVEMDFDTATRILDAGEPILRRPFDVWDVTSTWGSSRCVEAVGGGLFAELLSEAEDSRADPSGPAKVDFGLRLLRQTLADSVSRKWTLEIDGSRSVEELIGVEAMNVREVGANLPLAPDAEAGDGLLDVVLVSPDDCPALLEYVLARLEGDDDAVLPPLEIRRGRDVVFEPPSEVRLHVDDVLPAWDIDTTSWVEVAPAEVHLEVAVADQAG